MNCGNKECRHWDEMEAVNCAAHYSPAECMDYVDILPKPKPTKNPNDSHNIIRERLTKEQYFGWLLGNTIEASLNQNSSNTNILNAEGIAQYAQWMTDFLIEEGE